MAQNLSEKFKTTQKNEEKIKKNNLITIGVSVCHKNAFMSNPIVSLLPLKAVIIKGEAWGTLALPVQKYPHT